jgi:predicted aspartyl protease
MAKSYTFERHTEDDLILVTAQLDNSLVDFVLDTGASHTFIDFGILIKEGYRKNDTKGIVPIETANGIIFADRYIVSKITALGITKTNFEVTSYLFDEPESDFKGVIGLDFLVENEFCISLKKSVITIKS